MEIQIDSFGIIWQAPGKAKKTKKRENKELNQLYKEQQEEPDEMIEQGLEGKDVKKGVQHEKLDYGTKDKAPRAYGH